MLGTLAPLLGCGVMMLVCMGVMRLGGSRHHDAAPLGAADEVTALRAEVARLTERLDAHAAALPEEPAR